MAVFFRGTINLLHVLRPSSVHYLFYPIFFFLNTIPVGLGTGVHVALSVKSELHFAVLV